MEKTSCHADNCVGQNKNNILLGYLAWRICNNRNNKIVLSFMSVGHTIVYVSVCAHTCVRASVCIMVYVKELRYFVYIFKCCLLDNEIIIIQFKLLIM